MILLRRQGVNCDDLATPFGDGNGCLGMPLVGDNSAFGAPVYIPPASDCYAAPTSPVSTPPSQLRAPTPRRP